LPQTLSPFKGSHQSSIEGNGKPGRGNTSLDPVCKFRRETKTGKTMNYKIPVHRVIYFH
jgi:hypothetical protein